MANARRGSRPVVPPLQRCLPSPAERYLNYLLVIKALSNDEVKQTAALDGLEAGDDVYLDRLRAAAPPPPNPTWPTGGGLSRTVYLDRLGVTRLVWSDDVCAESFEILRTPKPRQLVEALTIAGARQKQIALMVSRITGLKLTETSIASYQHLFFSISKFSRVELKVLFEQRVQREADRLAGGDQRLRRSIVRDLRDAPWQAALSVPASPLAIASVLIRAGVLPPRLNLREVIETARETAGLRMNEALHRNGPKDDRRASAYADVARQATQLLDQLEEPAANLIEQFAQFGIAHDNRPKTLLHKLTGGNHSTDPQVAAAPPDHAIEE